MGKQLEPEWRTSSYTGTNGNCVEIGSADRVMVRDTKDRDGVTLSIPAHAWERFAASLR
jgi:Domain of unknown function (DUF397)